MFLPVLLSVLNYHSGCILARKMTEELALKSLDQHRQLPTSSHYVTNMRSHLFRPRQMNAPFLIVKCIPIQCFVRLFLITAWTI